MANINDFAYEGKYKRFVWDISYNPNATIENGMANCTTLAYAYAYINHKPLPVKKIVSAGNWNRVLTNGWKAELYGSIPLKKGDILEWDDHVATMISTDRLASSFYTGEHGKSIYEGKYDTRNFASLKEMSDWMVANYPYRFYHETDVATESNQIGSLPKYILVSPESVEPVQRDPGRDQIEVLTNEQNIRDNDGNIVGVAESGFYNVYGSKQANGYIWYMVAENRYIALVKGRVVFLPSNYEELKKENEELKRRLEEISKLCSL